MHWRSARRQTRSARQQTHVQISPAMIAVIVAVVGQAAILLNDFGSGNHQLANDAVTAAAVRKAGAIEIPEGP
jgi:hypothetical protein